jgi:hypothetical protein
MECVSCSEMRIRLRLDWIDVHAATIAVEADVTLDERVDGVITAKTDILSWLPFSSALAEDDVAGNYGLTTELLYTTALAVAVASVLNTSLSFFMSHD